MRTIQLSALKNKSKSFRTVKMAEQVNEVAIGLNLIQTVAGNVKGHFGANYTNLKTGEHGLTALISEILTDHGAVFSQEAVESNRQLAIAGSMFTNQIIAEVQRRFSGKTKDYPPQSIRDYLSTHGRKHFGKIQLTKEEDSKRTCNKPRNKWYLLIENNLE